MEAEEKKWHNAGRMCKASARVICCIAGRGFICMLNFLKGRPDLRAYNAERAESQCGSHCDIDRLLMVLEELL